MTQKLVRVQMELPEDSIEKLDRLREATGLRTPKELFENALALFSKSVEQSQAGWRVAFIDPERDRYREFSMPALETAFRKK